MSGLDQISVVAVGYGAVVAVAATYAALRLRQRPPWLDSMAWMLELLLGVRAVAGVGSILAGHRPAELSTNVGYLIASVCIVPIALGSGSDPSQEDERGPWSAWVLVVAVVAVVAVAVRTMMTL